MTLEIKIYEHRFYENENGIIRLPHFFFRLGSCFLLIYVAQNYALPKIYKSGTYRSFLGGCG